MNTATNQRFLGRKIWYGIAITLCVLVVLISLASAAGTWVLGSRVSSIATRLLLVVENTADGLSSIVERIDLQVAEVEDITTALSDATAQIGENVMDQGLILALLPEEREQNLTERAEELQQNLQSTGETINQGLELYQSIDSLPFVSLPKPDPESVTNLEQSITAIRDRSQEVGQNIQQVRAGVSGEIGKVTALLDDITASLTEVRQNLAQIASNLEALQDLVARWREMIPLLFTSLNVIISLLFVWLIYTQVEIIRMYIQRWKGLNGEQITVSPGEEYADSASTGAMDSEEQGEEITEQP